MATIGTFTKDGDEFSGSLETLTLRARMTLSPNAKKIHSLLLAGLSRRTKRPGKASLN